MLDANTAAILTPAVEVCKDVITVPQHPSVGEASILLATVSVLPPLLWKAVTDSKVSRGIWVVVIIGCMTLELYAIKWDQMKRASEQEHSECIARKQFAEVVAGLSQTKRGLDATASGIDTASNRLQGISGQITNVLQKTQEAADMASEGVANLTGGDSYVVVSPIFVSLNGAISFPLIAGIGKNGKNRTLENVLIQVRKLPIPNEGTMTQLMDVLSGKNAGLVFSGTLLSHMGQQVGEITPDSLGETSYVVNVSLRNKHTVETLRVRRTDTGQWEYSYTVGQDMMDGSPGRDDTLKPLEETTPTWRTMTPILKP